MRRSKAGWLGLLALLGLLLAVGEVTHRDDATRDKDERTSTFFTDATGARAILLVLQQCLGNDNVIQLCAPIDAMEETTAGHPADTLIVVGPRQPLNEAEIGSLDDWIRHGGQLVLATRDGWSLESAQVQFEPAEDDDNTETPARPEGGDPPPRTPPVPKKHKPKNQGNLVTIGNYLGLHHLTMTCIECKPAVVELTGSSLGASPMKISMRTGVSWKGKFEPEAVETASHKPLAISISEGSGRIVVIPDPGAFSNQSLGLADNAVWIANLVSAWGNGRAMFDEYHQGFGDRSGLTHVIWDSFGTRWGRGLLQLAMAALLYCVWYRRRLGAVVTPITSRRRDPLLLLDARTGLLSSAGATALAVEQIYLSLLHMLPKELSSLPEAQAARVQQLLAIYEKSKQGRRVRGSELLKMARLAIEIRLEVLRGRA